MDDEKTYGLDLYLSNYGRAVFLNLDDANDSYPMEYITWQEMGRPGTITVTPARGKNKERVVKAGWGDPF